MFGDPEVSLVMPVSGGTGAGHLVDLLDPGLIRAHPKVFTAFSDPSVLSNSILATAGLPSVHGVSGFQFFGWAYVDESTETAFWQMVSGPIAGLEVPGANWRVHRAAGPAVSGPVVGGNLWAISALAGTRWMPSTAGAILPLEAMDGTLFEDVDRLLTQLRLAGTFDGIVGRAFGAPADWKPCKNAPDTGSDQLVLRAASAAGSRSSPGWASATSRARFSSRSAAGWSSTCAAKASRCCVTWRTSSRWIAETIQRTRCRAPRAALRPNPSSVPTSVRLRSLLVGPPAAGKLLEFGGRLRQRFPAADRHAEEVGGQRRGRAVHRVGYDPGQVEHRLLVRHPQGSRPSSTHTKLVQSSSVLIVLHSALVSLAAHAWSCGRRPAGG